MKWLADEAERARLREHAAVVLQKNARRFLTARVVSRIRQYERMFRSIKWTEEGAERVSVVGDFTRPQWQKQIQLDYCPVRKIFVKYVHNLSRGDYCVKFVVDGITRVSGRLPLIPDGRGGYNNLLEVDRHRSSGPA